MYGFTEMMMEEAEKQFSQEGREKKTMTSEEKLAIGEAIHAMMWLDKHCKGWGLEEECAILQNMCNNQEEKEIRSNHNYLDLQYQLYDTTKENEQLQKLVEQLRLEIKKSEEELSDCWQVHDEQAREIRQLREETTILRMGEKAANKLILQGREMEELFTCYNCGKKIDEVDSQPVLGEIHFDPGYTGSNYEPPEPHCTFFVCSDCLEFWSNNVAKTSWKITKERKEALIEAYYYLWESDMPCTIRHRNVLKAMFDEAKQ